MCKLTDDLIVTKNSIVQVLPGLYVGNYRDSKDPVQLDKYKITHILSIHDAARRLHAVSSFRTLSRTLLIKTFIITISERWTKTFSSLIYVGITLV